ncbi:MAG: ABC transporter ATP-binding protein [Actinomycetota bacterium]|nr:MAG: ABC transporter ATP-binding protein [Actinomycetota bacterium]
MSADAQNNRLVVNKGFKKFDDLQVLDDIDFVAEPAEFVSIVGTSGCGKTTLLRIISGLEPATKGEVMPGEERVRGPNLGIGTAFQSDRLMPWRTVKKNITLGLELRRRGKAVDRAKVDALLPLFGLKEFSESYPHQLSGGMKQRVNLALAIDPKVLLLDEPFAALDAQTREVMQTELLRIWGETKKTVVFITHQIDEAVYLSDRVVVLRRRPGRIREIVKIDLPRPRELSVKRSPEFNEYVEYIWEQLEGDVKAAELDERSMIAGEGE